MNYNEWVETTVMPELKHKGQACWLYDENDGSLIYVANGKFADDFVFTHALVPTSRVNEPVLPSKASKYLLEEVIEEYKKLIEEELKKLREFVEKLDDQSS